MKHAGLLSFEEVAARAGCNRATVARSRARGDLAAKSVLDGNRRYLVETDEADRWIAWRLATPERQSFRRTRPAGDPLLVSELAKLAKVSKDLILRDIRLGRIPFFRVEGMRGVWIRDSDAATYLARRRDPSARVWRKLRIP